ACLPTWRSARRQTSTRAWARSGRHSWISRLRRSSSRDSGRVETLEEEASMKDESKAPGAATASAKVGRRDFLRVLGSGVGIAAGAGELATTPAHADSETDDEKRKSRYRETDHVKTFYRVNRYPTKG